MSGPSALFSSASYRGNSHSSTRLTIKRRLWRLRVFSAIKRWSELHPAAVHKLVQQLMFRSAMAL
jgi:hypothetical protein